MQGPEKNSYKEFDNEKKIPAARKFPSPSPPHNFSNGPSLIVTRAKSFFSRLRPTPKIPTAREENL